MANNKAEHLEIFALNDYAAVLIDPAVAAPQDEGSIKANDESWEASFDFASDAALFDFMESMMEDKHPETKPFGRFTYQAALMDEEDGVCSTYYATKAELPGLYGVLVMVSSKPGASLADFEAILATLELDESSIPAAEEAPAGGTLESDWARVQFDADVASLRYHTVEAKDGSWSVEFGLPMNEFGAETSRNDYKLITLGYGDQTDIVTGEKTLGCFDYRTIRYTQFGRCCAYYDCTFAAPRSVTAKIWDGSEESANVYGVYIHCKANDSETLNNLEEMIASLEITEA